MHARQDLAMARKQLLCGMAEASAVEYDVVGRVGARLGEGSATDRGVIAADMELQEVRDYARQAVKLRDAVSESAVADSTVGYSHITRTFDRLGAAAGASMSAARSEEETRRQEDLVAWRAHVDQLQPILDSRREKWEQVRQAKEKLENELVRMRRTVDAIREQQRKELGALAHSVVQFEMETQLEQARAASGHGAGGEWEEEGESGDPSEAQLAVLVQRMSEPLDESAGAVSARRDAAVRQAEEAARKEYASRAERMLDSFRNRQASQI